MSSVAARNEMGSTADALAAALILAVGMGFGRFSFTGMYPLMVHEGQLSIAGGSLAASANYLGYLVGALMMSRVHHRHSARLCRMAMAGTILCIAALSLDFGASWIFAARFIAGVFSALAMVTASTWLFQVVGYHQGAPVLYSGVGTGIVLSAEMIAASSAGGWHSSATWLGLAAGATLLSAMAWQRISRNVAETIPDQADFSDPLKRVERPMGSWLIIAIYGLAGFGYIVTATYLPLFVKNALGGVNPIQVWAAFGLGAVPSCFLWHALHHALGSRRALMLNLGVQAIGVILPVLSSSGIAFMASAVLVGGTFVGTVTIAMPAAKKIAASVRYNMMAAMTSAYGVGQIAGPLISNALLSHAHSFNPPLLIAGGGLLAAALGCLL